MITEGLFTNFVKQKIAGKQRISRKTCHLSRIYHKPVTPKISVMGGDGW